MSADRPVVVWTLPSGAEVGEEQGLETYYCN